MKFKYIDSIRGIAILMVILVHTSQKINGLGFVADRIAAYGQMGVQLFFIVSAYTLCLSAERREKETLSLAKFGIRRFFRIAPAYYIGILIYFIVSIVYSKLNSGELQISDRYNPMNLISNLTFTHGFYPPANNNIVPGGWSIGTEMAFYSIFPILFLLAQKRLCFSILKIAGYIVAGVLFSQMIIISLNQVGIKLSNNSFVYYNLINQLPVFLLGIGYFFLQKRNILNFNWVVNLMLFIFFTLLSRVLWYLDIDYLFSVIPFISGLSFIFLIELFRKNDFLNWKFLTRIGQASYSMYLLHFIFAWYFAEFFVSRFEFIPGSLLLVILYIFTILSTFGLALISERYIEKPGVEFGKTIIKRLDEMHANRSRKRSLKSVKPD